MSLALNTQQLAFDWRGLQCPEPILNTARAVRKLQGQPAQLTILADDSGFPLDIESWCRTSGAQLVKISTTPEGAYEAVLALNKRAANTNTTPRSMPAPRKTSIGLRPSPEAHLPKTPETPQNLLDCRGELCPAPVLKLAAWNRKLGDLEGHLDILADDPAFPLDVESWCRTAQVRLLSLQHEGATWRATLHKPAAKKLDLQDFAHLDGISPDGTLPGLPSREIDALQRPHSSHLKNEPELKLSDLPREALDTLPGAPGPTGRRTPQRSSPTPAPTPARAASTSAPNLPTAPPQHHALSFDLRGMNTEQWGAQLQTLTLLDLPGQEVRVQGDDPSIAHALVQLSRQRGAALVKLHTDAHGLDATLRLGHPKPVEASAPQPSSEALTTPRPCTLLVLHNDFEALMAALMTANAAAAGGLDVQIFFSFWGVNLLRAERPLPSSSPRPPLLKRLFAWMMPRGPQRQQLGKLNFGGIGTRLLRSFMKKDKIMGVEQLMQAAIDNGVTFVVCTTSMSIMGLRTEDLAPLPNLSYGGVASFVEQARGSSMSLVF